MAYLQQLAIHEHGNEEGAEDLSKHPPLLLEEGLTVLHAPVRSRTISTGRLDAYSRSKPERKNSLITTTTSTSRIGIVACGISFSQVLCAVLCKRSYGRSSFGCHLLDCVGLVSVTGKRPVVSSSTRKTALTSINGGSATHGTATNSPKCNTPRSAGTGKRQFTFFYTRFMEKLINCHSGTKNSSSTPSNKATSLASQKRQVSIAVCIILK